MLSLNASYQRVEKMKEECLLSMIELTNFLSLFWLCSLMVRIVFLLSLLDAPYNSTHDWRPYSHEHTTRSFVVSALMLSEVVLAKSSFYTAIHWDLSDHWIFRCLSLSLLLCMEGDFQSSAFCFCLLGVKGIPPYQLDSFLLLVGNWPLVNGTQRRASLLKYPCR